MLGPRVAGARSATGQLEPEFEKAAAFMLGRVAFAKVDATLEVELAEEYNVQGYPTVQLFKSGAREDYTGGRLNESIVKWVEEHLGPPLNEVLTDDEMQKMLRDRRNSSYFVAKGGQELKDVFKIIAENSQYLGVFFFIPGAVGDPPLVQVYRGTDEVVKFGETEVADLENVHAFLLKEALPLFGQISDENYAAYAALAEHGLLWVCFHPDTIAQDFERLGIVFREVSAYFAQFQVAYIDTKEYKEHTEDELGCTEFPSVVLQLGNFTNTEVELKHYRTALQGEVTAQAVRDWITSVLAGLVAEDDDFETDDVEPQDGTNPLGSDQGHGEEL